MVVQSFEVHWRADMASSASLGEETCSHFAAVILEFAAKAPTASAEATAA